MKYCSYLTIYAAFGLGAALVLFANGVLLYSLCVIRSATSESGPFEFRWRNILTVPDSAVMHDRMFNAVLRSPMLFFETTPLGTILNRFSRDVYVIDEVLARVFGGFFRTMAGVVGMVVVITTGAPLFLLVLVPLLFIYKSVQT